MNIFNVGMRCNRFKSMSYGCVAVIYDTVKPNSSRVRYEVEKSFDSRFYEIIPISNIEERYRKQYFGVICVQDDIFFTREFKEFTPVDVSYIREVIESCTSVKDVYKEMEKDASFQIPPKRLFRACNKDTNFYNMIVVKSIVESGKKPGATIQTSDSILNEIKSRYRSSCPKDISISMFAKEFISKRVVNGFVKFSGKTPEELIMTFTYKNERVQYLYDCLEVFERLAKLDLDVFQENIVNHIRDILRVCSKNENVRGVINHIEARSSSIGGLGDETLDCILAAFIYGGAVSNIEAVALKNYLTCFYHQKLNNEDYTVSEWLGTNNIGDNYAIFDCEYNGFVDESLRHFYIDCIISSHRVHKGISIFEVRDVNHNRFLGMVKPIWDSNNLFIERCMNTKISSVACLHLGRFRRSIKGTILDRTLVCTLSSSGDINYASVSDLQGNDYGGGELEINDEVYGDSPNDIISELLIQVIKDMLSSVHVKGEVVVIPGSDDWVFKEYIATYRSKKEFDTILASYNRR